MIADYARLLQDLSAQLEGCFRARRVASAPIFEVCTRLKPPDSGRDPRRRNWSRGRSTSFVRSS
jgi:hypothetical protein